MSRSLQDHIEEVMDEFDFHKVQRHMESVNWKWLSLTPARVPDVTDLRRESKRYLTNAAMAAQRGGRGWSMTGSGGLHAYACCNPATGEIYWLDLHFSIETRNTSR